MSIQVVKHTVKSDITRDERYVYICIYMHVCVCVRERERKREREHSNGSIYILPYYIYAPIIQRQLQDWDSQPVSAALVRQPLGAGCDSRS
jgi:hypothetical protein